MMNSQDSGARPHRWRVEPTCGLARRHWAVGVSPILRSSSSTFLRPFAPDPLRSFLALMDALTPARSVQAVLGLFPAATLSAPREQVSLIHAPDLPTIPSPTTCVRSVSPRHVTCRRIEPRLLPDGNSGLRHSLAGSPHHTGRPESKPQASRRWYLFAGPTVLGLALTSNVESSAERAFATTDYLVPVDFPVFYLGGKVALQRGATPLYYPPAGR